jgi:hypothetical protein
MNLKMTNGQGGFVPCLTAGTKTTLFDLTVCELWGGTSLL